MIRNLLIRTASGIVFLAIFLAALLWHPAAYCAIFTAAVIIMMGEYLKITLGDREPAARVISISTGALMMVLPFLHAGYGMDPVWFLLLPALTVLLYIAVLYCKEKESYRSSPFLLSALLYIALPFGLTNLVVFDGAGNFDGRILLAVMILIWTSDVGAYLFGITFGRKNGHKLFPSISPNKSWEGYIGGLATALLAGYLISRFGLVRFSWYHSVILALIINVTGTLGDLAESQLKRNFGVKDAGKIMPGHGGLLDRFDGALFAFPATVLYLLATAIN